MFKLFVQTIIVLTFWLTVSNAAPSQLDWTKIAADSPPSASANAQDVARIRTLISQEVAEEQFSEYAEFVLATATAWREGNVAETYSILRILGDRFAGKITSKGRSELAAALAGELIQLGLPWRARDIWQSIPPEFQSAQTPDSILEIPQFADLLTVAVPPGAVPSLFTKEELATARPDDAMTRIFQLLLVNEGAEDMSQLDLEPLSLCAGMQCQEGFDLLAEPGAQIQAPILTVLDRLPDASVAQHSVFRRYVYDQREKIKTFTPTDKESRELARILDEYNSGKSPSLGSESLSQVPPLGPLEKNHRATIQERRIVDPEREVLVVAVEEIENEFARTYYVLVLRHDVGRNSEFGPVQSISIHEYSEVPEIQLLDVLGDGNKRLVVKTRAGSGGYLSVDVLDLKQNEMLWRATELQKGSVAFLNIDRDPELEILVKSRAAWSFCNQCDSANDLVILDYKTRRHSYWPVSFRRPFTRSLAGQGVGPFGLTDAVALAEAGTRYTGALSALKDAKG
jgi:hypothetical protein